MLYNNIAKTGLRKPALSESHSESVGQYFVFAHASLGWWLSVCFVLSREIKFDLILTADMKSIVHTADIESIVHTADIESIVHTADIEGIVHTADIEGIVHTADIEGIVHTADMKSIVHTAVSETHDLWGQ